ASGFLGNWTLGGTFIAAIAILLYLAIRLSTARPRLNLTLAAETVVALGIFSLIISIMVVILGVSEFMMEFTSRDPSLEHFRCFALPFAEGLMAAAIAPFIATILRHVESNTAAADSADTGIADAARAAATLAEELKATITHFHAVNAEIDSTKDAFTAALG